MKGTKQIIISLGCIRPLTIDLQKYEMPSGSSLAFESEYHSLNKCRTDEGRISIAIFTSNK